MKNYLDKECALNFYKNIFSQTDIESIMSDNTPCRELQETSLFHFDLFGNYIPSLCSGLAIEAADIGKELDEMKYQFISILFKRGVGGLLEMASDDYGFHPGGQYLSKYHLCTEIRNFSISDLKHETFKLNPVEFYREFYVT